jgi:hypothetical protein
MVAKLAAQLGGEDTPLPVVALSGGVFQNRILFERVLAGLDAKGFRVLTHARVPCNDAGLALGQATIAAARLSSGAAAPAPAAPTSAAPPPRSAAPPPRSAAPPPRSGAPPPKIPHEY